MSLQFLDTGLLLEGRVVEVDTISSPPLMEVQFGELVSLADLAAGEPAPVVTAGFRLRSEGDDGSPTTDQVGRRLHLFFELVEELRGLANFAARGSPASYSRPAVVERLSVASPAEITLSVSDVIGTLGWQGVATAELMVIRKLPQLRREWIDGSNAAEDLRTKQAERLAKERQAEKDAAIADLARLIRKGSNNA